MTATALVARLMAALVHAAPEALRHDKGKKSAAAKFPEFRAWHVLLQPLFAIEPPDWTEKAPPATLPFEIVADHEDDDDVDEADEDEESEG